LLEFTKTFMARGGFTHEQTRQCIKQKKIDAIERNWQFVRLVPGLKTV